jgi:NAD(P)H-dependent FMN reductase
MSAAALHAAPDTAPLRTAVITASTRDGRFGPTVTQWFTRLAAGRDDLETELVDPAEHPVPNTLSWSPPAEDRQLLAPLTAKLEAADAFVIVTPEYNHSFPASLKQAVDWHYTQWQAKPVGFVSYGGIGGGLRAVEQLRLVFAELHAVTVRDSVSLHRAHEAFDGDGELRESAVAEGAAKGMLDQLAWWGRALRAARAEHPYGR